MTAVAAERRSAVLKRVALSATALNVAGIGVAIYLTVEHYSAKPSFACPTTGVINCVKVTTSSYAVVAGVPAAVLGLVFFAVSGVLHLPQLWQSQLRWLRRLRLLWSATGAAMVFWFVYVELFRLDAICLYCTAVHALALALFVLTAVGTAAIAPAGEPTGHW